MALDLLIYVVVVYAIVWPEKVGRWLRKVHDAFKGD